MKKSFYLISLAAMVIAGCAKEAPETQEQTITPNNKVVALYATMPEFIDAQTKAGVNDSGDFTWDESDPISVIYTNGTDEKEIIFLCADASEGRFEPVDPTDIEVGYTLKTEGTVAYYPTGYDGTPSNCDYAMEIDEAKANFQMHATNDNGSLKFVHDNALLKVTVSNVPAFAKTLTVGGVSVNLNLTEAGDVTAYIPVAPAASAKMSISVTDDANNTIISKNSEKKVAIEAANLYNLPNLTIGPIILIKNNVMSEKGENSWSEIDAASGRINLHTYIPGEKDFTSYDNSNCQFNELIISGNPYVYYVYPANYAGREVHVNLRCLGYDYPKLETDIVISGVSEYSFGFAQGLKKSSDKFIYAMFEGSDTAKCKVYVEDGGSAVFGSWWDTNPTQAVVMYNDGSEKRFLNIYDITSCSSSATFEPIENGNKYYMYDWSWATKVAFSDANGISDYYLIYKWENPDHHVYNKDFTYLANLVY